MSELTLAQTLTGEISSTGTLTGTLSEASTLSGGLTIPDEIRPEAYQGSYTVTPTEETIVLETKDKETTANITINPIPTNYGKLTWNGTTLIVS